MWGLAADRPGGEGGIPPQCHNLGRSTRQVWLLSTLLKPTVRGWVEAATMDLCTPVYLCECVYASTMLHAACVSELLAATPLSPVTPTCMLPPSVDSSAPLKLLWHEGATADFGGLRRGACAAAGGTAGACGLGIAIQPKAAGVATMAAVAGAQGTGSGTGAARARSACESDAAGRVAATCVPSAGCRSGCIATERAAAERALIVASGLALRHLARRSSCDGTPTPSGWSAGLLQGSRSAWAVASLLAWGRGWPCPGGGLLWLTAAGVGSVGSRSSATRRHGRCGVSLLPARGPR